MNKDGANTILFSVVTPSLNCASHILGNIESVNGQGFGPDQMEHWIIDGGSADGTIDILRPRTDVKWISEPDGGLSDAVNKGIQRSRGQWIIWLNADDRLCPGAMKTFLRHAERHPSIRLFCGDQIVLRYDGRVEQTVKGWAYTFHDLVSRRSGINQASTWVAKEVYAAVGLIDVGIKYAMDYEWMVRATRQFECVYIPEVLSVYQRRRGSIMDAHMADHFRTFRMVRRRYRRSLLEPLEFMILYYLWTEPLRRYRPLRRFVRRVPKRLGCEPLHPC